MTPEQKSELARISRGGNCSHDVWVETDTDPPAVGLANDCDDHYVQYFRDRAELETFITELRKAADEAWGVHLDDCRDTQWGHSDGKGNIGIGS